MDNNIIEIKKFIESIKDESVAFEINKNEKKLVATKKGNVRKRRDGYFNINVPSKENNRMAIVPRDTIERLIKEKTSFRPLKDRYNTLSALTQTFDKPLMYYAIVAYDMVPKEEYEKWNTSTPLLKYEMIHLNGDIDDIRKDNVRLTYKDVELWEQIKENYKSKNKIGADVEYARQREEHFRKKLGDYPNLKIMVRVIDPVKKEIKHTKEYNSDEIIQNN